MSLPSRQRLHHETPEWVKAGSPFFVTLCCTPRGENQLTSSPQIPNAVLGSVAHYHTNNIWWVHLFLLMPDHAHALLAVAPDKDLSSTVRAWKSWQTKTLNIRWQSGFFDHRLRSDESLEEKAHYVRQNPVRAGLVSDAATWPHAWAPAR